MIFIDENIPFLSKALEKCGKIILFGGRSISNAWLAGNEAKALITRSTTKVNESLLKGTSIKFAATATSGFDHIDTDYLKRAGIAFAYAPASNANSVAEYVVYSILRWSEDNKVSLEGKKAGIIGFGNIGKIVGKYASQMGLEILVNDPPLLEQGFIFPENFRYLKLDSLLYESDIITNHVPLVQGGFHPTFRLLDEERLRLIGKNTLFIHASRGWVVDETALITKALKDSLSLAIDVWEREPLPNRELVRICMLATPHVAGYSKDGKTRGAAMIARAYCDFSGCKADMNEIEMELSVYKPLAAEEFKFHKNLLESLTESRKLDYDSRTFKAIMNLEDRTRAAAFDDMRKNYPQRREIL